MPTYEYQCRACGHCHDEFQKMSDAPLTTCPACHAETLQKLVSAAGFQLKGTGWYATDFKSKPKSTATAGAESTSAAAGEVKATSSQTDTQKKTTDKETA